jgi:hypothetical protein
MNARSAAPLGGDQRAALQSTGDTADSAAKSDSAQAPRDPQRRACPGCSRKMRAVHLAPYTLPNGNTRPLCRRCTWQLNKKDDRAHDLRQRLLAEALAEPPAEAKVGDEP